MPGSHLIPNRPQGHGVQPNTYIRNLKNSKDKPQLLLTLRMDFICYKKKCKVLRLKKGILGTEIKKEQN